jgi:riboflavin kinase/FMN adenylyltransferase
MQRFNGLNDIPADGAIRVLTVGSFDGLHLGHRSLIGQVIAKAKEFGVRSAVLSFDPHPAAVLRPDKPLARLFGIGDLVEQLSAMGVDDLILEPFTLELAKLSAKEFVQKILQRTKIKMLIVGYDFAFGHNREGGFDEILAFGREFGFDVFRLSPHELGGEVVSSSRIRKLIEQGDVLEAQKLLGRPYYLEGQVESGDGRGRSLGFATANLKCQTMLKPQPGVYVTKFRDSGEPSGSGRISVTNVGYKPTFHTHHELTIETHVLDADVNFVGKNVRVDFYQRLREELKFNSPRELIEQIEKDVQRTRNFFGE